MSLPIFPLNAVLFPGTPMPLRIFEARYLRMLAERASISPIFGISLIMSGSEAGGEPTYHDVGTTARLVSLNAQGSSAIDVVIVGERRIRMAPGDWKLGYAVSETEELPDLAFDTERAGELLAAGRGSYESYLNGVASIMKMGFEVPELGNDPGTASFEIATRLPLHTWEQQALLQNVDPISRLEDVSALLNREIALLYRAGMVGVPIRSPGDRFTLN